MSLNESIIEEAALEWFGELGYAVGHGPHLAPGETAAERDSFSEEVLVGRLRDAIFRLNPSVPGEAREDALRKVLRVGSPSLTGTNRDFHRMLRDGVEVEYQRADGSIAGDHVRLVDFTEVESRISKLSLNAAALPGIDEEFDEITEGEELTKKEKLKTKWAALEALVGDPKRIAMVAEDLARHFERRVEAMEGKAMIASVELKSVWLAISASLRLSA